MVGTGLLVMIPGCKFDFFMETRSGQIQQYEKAKPGKAELGAARFLFDDLGGLNSRTLETNAFPWKVVTTAMLMEQHSRDGLPISPSSLPALFQKFGWLTPAAVENWPGKEQPQFAKPTGIVSGELRRDLPKVRLEVANMGCAACHAGPSYDQNGVPTGRIWLGSSNTSRFFDGYTRAIFTSLRHVRHRQEELMATIPKVFPDVHRDELATIRKYVLPQIAKRLDAAEGNNDILVQFQHGGVGLTNGIAALKLRLNAKPSLVGEREYGYASIPDLYGRRLRSSVLYDGLYALEGTKRFVEKSEGSFSTSDHARLSSIVAFFIVPSMGIRPTDSEKQAKRIGDILNWSLDYKPQPFPGPIDRQKAGEGRAVYDQKCASCHGKYSPGLDGIRLVSYPNRLVPQSGMGSDPERWRAISDRMVNVISKTPVGKRVNAANAQGYVAPILNGLWASGPYLHNGSVPTVWHLLHPSERPSKFAVGGHRLDFQKLGLAGEVDADGVYRDLSKYQPWSTPVVIDTTRPGLGNAGHESEFNDLSAGEKAAILEFLKLL